MGSWLLAYAISWATALGGVAVVELYRLGRSQPPRPWLNDIGAACLVWVLLPLSPLVGAAWLWIRLRARR